jgi:N-acyl-D-aspartate/D-glutamate deacylase
VEDAIKKMTSVPAKTLGLADRGTLSVGSRADINVIELNQLNEKQPQLVHDFPGNAPRFIQKASGYRATVCNGATILLDDELTGESGGQIIRSRS